MSKKERNLHPDLEWQLNAEIENYRTEHGREPNSLAIERMKSQLMGSSDPYASSTELLDLEFDTDDSFHFQEE